MDEREMFEDESNKYLDQGVPQEEEWREERKRKGTEVMMKDIEVL